jgi:TRAP-type C4-dicarboxylate transport system permease small subunit
MGKKVFFYFVMFSMLGITVLNAQCSICTKTASQLGEGPASALNSAILYLAAAPFAIMGYIGWKWWKNEKELNKK